MTDFTRNIGTIRPQPRARSSGRFQRVAVARWMERHGARARVGRPSAVTPELEVEGKRLLQEGLSVTSMCDRLGVDRSSWYRFVRRDAGPSPKRRARHRRSNAISADVERQMLKLDREGLTRVAIAERLGLHINTVVKYLLRAGRPRRK